MHRLMTSICLWALLIDCIDFNPLSAQTINNSTKCRNNGSLEIKNGRYICQCLDEHMDHLCRITRVTLNRSSLTVPFDADIDSILKRGEYFHFGAKIFLIQKRGGILLTLPSGDYENSIGIGIYKGIKFYGFYKVLDKKGLATGIADDKKWHYIDVFINQVIADLSDITKYNPELRGCLSDDGECSENYDSDQEDQICGLQGICTNHYGMYSNGMCKCKPGYETENSTNTPDKRKCMDESNGWSLSRDGIIGQFNYKLPFQLRMSFRTLATDFVLVNIPELILKIEVIQGKPRCSTYKEKILLLNVNVADGDWHQYEVYLSRYILEFKVDGKDGDFYGISMTKKRYYVRGNVSMVIGNVTDYSCLDDLWIHNDIGTDPVKTQYPLIQNGKQDVIMKLNLTNVRGKCKDSESLCKNVELGTNEVCVPNWPTQYIRCRDNYVRDTNNEACVPKQCYTRPCNEGDCYVDNDSTTAFKCNCYAGWKGERCDMEDLCYDKPCENGECQQPTANTFECNCTDGWIGKLCNETDPCSLKPCKNGTCLVITGEESTGDPNKDFNCDCSRGWKGKLCNETDPCSLKPCKNGTCLVITGEESTGDPNKDFNCKCFEGWQGSECDQQVVSEEKWWIPFLIGSVCIIIIFALFIYCWRRRRNSSNKQPEVAQQEQQSVFIERWETANSSKMQKVQYFLKGMRDAIRTKPGISTEVSRDFK